ncbi:CARDB domain-containing protein [Vitreimonas flagellata]|uniref:CARDB domain-containing protein n=1 Tax=Vitreimonas flagellata TaxID=2560861 RepID=UPI00143055DD|nr:CARDB domain-containing protein [Vitreimonas flagellata]
MMHTLFAGVAAATFLTFGFGYNDAAYAQQVTRAQPAQVGPVANDRLVARTIDLHPIPSRIEHGVVAVRNIGTTASAPSIITVNCHVPGQEGGCVDVPERLLAGYANPAYPNRLVVQVPAIQPGRVYNHTLSFWDNIVWPAGAYQFDFVADAGATNNESHEANNTGSHVWNAP